MMARGLDFREEEVNSQEDEKNKCLVNKYLPCHSNKSLSGKKVISSHRHFIISHPQRKDRTCDKLQSPQTLKIHWSREVVKHGRKLIHPPLRKKRRNQFFWVTFELSRPWSLKSTCQFHVPSEQNQFARVRTPAHCSWEWEMKLPLGQQLDIFL